MKKFDVSAYGVEEMTKKEMQETNGGFLQWLIIGAICLAALLAKVWVNNGDRGTGYL